MEAGQSVAVTSGAIVRVGRLVIVGLTTAAVLIVDARSQILDANFVHLWEATALLAGDHPYRDLFEWGAPLAAYLSAGVQWAVGYRLIGELVLQWLFILAGVLIAFHLGFRLSRSSVAPLLVLPLVLVLLGTTPTYHYSKLFFIPLGIWLAWRYMDRPGLGRSVTLGGVTAVAFLFRHDYGIYLGWASVLALALPPAVGARTRDPRSLARDGAGYLCAVLVVLSPWALVVQSTEGLDAYRRLRTAKYEGVFGESYKALLQIDPIRQLSPPPPPPPRPAEVVFVWQGVVDARRQQELEQRFHLRPLEGRDAAGRLRYEVPNVYDPDLQALDGFINQGNGFQFERIQAMRMGLPSRENVAAWLLQMTLLVPLFLLVGAGVQWWRERFAAAEAGAIGPGQAALAALVLALVNASILREPGYALAVAPITAALGTRFMAGAGWRRPLVALRRSAALGVLALTMFAALVWTRDTAASGPLLALPTFTLRSVSDTFAILTASPPIEGSDSMLFRYLRECTTSGDRLLVTGPTPFHVSYYAERAVAGGHLYWDSRWGSDPATEARSLALLERQSVPIAMSTRDPIVEDFQSYPKILEYLQTHYVPVDGSRGRLLVDSRRRPTGTFGADKLPCFR